MWGHILGSKGIKPLPSPQGKNSYLLLAPVPTSNRVLRLGLLIVYGVAGLGGRGISIVVKPHKTKGLHVLEESYSSSRNRRRSGERDDGRDWSCSHLLFNHHICLPSLTRLLEWRERINPFITFGHLFKKDGDIKIGPIRILMCGGSD